MISRRAFFASFVSAGVASTTEAQPLPCPVCHFREEADTIGHTVVSWPNGDLNELKVRRDLKQIRCRNCGVYRGRLGPDR